MSMDHNIFEAVMDLRDLVDFISEFLEQILDDNLKFASLKVELQHLFIRGSAQQLLHERICLLCCLRHFDEVEQCDVFVIHYRLSQFEEQFLLIEHWLHV